MPLGLSILSYRLFQENDLPDLCHNGITVKTRDLLEPSLSAMDHPRTSFGSATEKAFFPSVHGAGDIYTTARSDKAATSPESPQAIHDCSGPSRILRQIPVSLPPTATPATRISGEIQPPCSAPKTSVRRSLPKILVADVLARVHKFATMTAAIPLTLRTEKARHDLHHDLLEYRDRLNEILEIDSHLVLNSGVPVTSSNNGAILENRVNPSVCNIKQTFGRNGRWKAPQGPCRTATLPDQQMTDGCTNGETSAYGVPSITPSLSRFRSMRSRAYSSNTYDPS